MATTEAHSSLKADPLICLVPGPTRCPPSVLSALAGDYLSPDIERPFLSAYKDAERMLQALMHTRNDVVIQTGEGMLALWSALRSCVTAGDKVLSISTGIFGTVNLNLNLVV